MFAIVAALTVGLAGLLPFTHVHADGDHPVVHRHVIGGDHGHDHEVPHGHAVDAEHSDHADATILTPAYQRAPAFAGLGYPATVRWQASPPARAAMPPAGRRTMLPTHDPPLRFVSSPAPPAAR